MGSRKMPNIGRARHASIEVLACTCVGTALIWAVPNLRGIGVCDSQQLTYYYYSEYVL